MRRGFCFVCFFSLFAAAQKWFAVLLNKQGTVKRRRTRGWDYLPCFCLRLSAGFPTTVWMEGNLPLVLVQPKRSFPSSSSSRPRLRPSHSLRIEREISTAKLPLVRLFLSCAAESTTRHFGVTLCLTLINQLTPHL